MKPFVADIPYKKLHVPIRSFDSLKQDTLKLAQNAQWVDHVNTKDYDGIWQVLPLRGLANHRNGHPILQAFQIDNDEPLSYVNYPQMMDIPGVGGLLQQLCCEVLSVRLMKLAPKASINTHRDHGLCFSKGQARLHLCLISNDQVVFTVDGKAIPISEGEFWYLNADRPHSVANHSDFPRIHLVIDCLSNHWLKQLIGLA